MMTMFHWTSAGLVLWRMGLSSVYAQSSAETCSEPISWTPLPNSYSLQQYTDDRASCTALCNAEGFCCTKDSGICNAAPCTTGCHIAWTTSSVEECKAECDYANGSSCEHNFRNWNYDQVAPAGLSPSLSFGIDLAKCVDASECGCAVDSGEECSETACHRGCELASSTPALQDAFFNGPSVNIDTRLGLDQPALFSALLSMKAHVDGSAPLSDSQLRNHVSTFVTNRALLDSDFDSLDAAMDLVATYESMRGALFLNPETSDGFDRQTLSNTNLEGAILLVQQGLMDIVFGATTSSNGRNDNTLMTLCKDYFQGRAWQTSQYFPGWVDAPQDLTATYTVQIDASKPAKWGMPVCFEEDAALKPTGLYLTPGGVAELSLPSSLVDKGYAIRIGATEADHVFKERHLRMDRVSGVFPITQENVHVASPLGGGIYIIVPYLAEDGLVSIQISGSVIESPFFSLNSVKETSSSEWERLRSSDAPWADFVTENFFMQLPTSWVSSYDSAHFKDLLEGRQEAMEAVSVLLGVPIANRNDYFSYIQPDVQIRADAFGVGYPQVNTLVASGPGGIIPDPTHWMVVSKYLEWDVYWHELGHCTMQHDYYSGETEAIVNILYAFVLNTLVGLDFDAAFKKSFNPINGFSPDEAFMHWAVTAEFRSGAEMDISDTVTNQMRYQERGYAKYADIARVFGGWGAYQSFNDLRQADYNSGIFNDSGLSDDDYRTLQLSRALGVDATPLIHFWGIHPGDPNGLSAFMSAQNLFLSNAVKDHLLRYIPLIPDDNQEFQAFMYEIYPNIDDPEWFDFTCESPFYGCGWFKAQQNLYSSADGFQAKSTALDIIRVYYPDAELPEPPENTFQPTRAPVATPSPSVGQPLCGSEGCGDCDIAKSGISGCSCEVCQNVVCSNDLFCCETEWDQICVDQALDECSCSDNGGPVANPTVSPTPFPTLIPTPSPTVSPTLLPTTGPTNIPTRSPSPKPTMIPTVNPTAAPIDQCEDCGTCSDEQTGPGCSCPSCQQLICDADPFCCDTQWDNICVEVAMQSCSCAMTGPPPPVEDESCQNCGTCGEIQTGAGCSCLACQELVCDTDPYCCDFEWDGVCREAVESLCTCA